jgi:hypothetical protein
VPPLELMSGRCWLAFNSEGRNAARSNLPLRSLVKPLALCTKIRTLPNRPRNFLLRVDLPLNGG